MARYLLAIPFFFFSTTAAFAQDAPLPARVAAQKMTLPPGFKATLFAGEPDVVQPIAFCFDDRGRLWVAECRSYPNWVKDPKQGKDRIVIFEDTDGDGVHDKRTVFANNIPNISGINYGFGGVWVCSTPNLLFIPIKEVGQAFQPDKGGEKRDEIRQAGKPDLRTVPAGPPQIVLDGWDLKARHNVFNSLTWGPDGWLYGCNGILSNSKVGAPGTPDKDRVKMNCGVWRYHPTKKKFEVVAHGTTNPWGLDFDEHGEMFITNCVIDHLWHIVPGGHYERMFGNDLNPHVYKLMPSICDHKHWGGGNWTTSRRPDARTQKGAGLDAYKIHSEAGGGHAHVGCMIYLGDNWPARYRGGVFMCNLHGNRINHDILERNGSTFVARHAKDFMHANDPWFRGLAIHYGPDGGVYVADWTDTGECHNYKVAHTTTGRIFKITYGDVQHGKGGRDPRFGEDGLAKVDDEYLASLASLSAHKSEWMSRHARRLLQERSIDRKIDRRAIRHLKINAIMERFGAAHQLHSIWTLHAIGELDEELLLELLGEPQPHVRAWAVRLSLERGEERKDADIRENKLQNRIHSMARSDPSALVRLQIASSLQRIPTGDRGEILRALCSHAEDTNDPYLPFMYWHALEPTLELRNEAFYGLRSPIPLLREYTARHSTERYHPRVVSSDKIKKLEIAGPPALEIVFAILARVDEPPVHRDVLRGIQQGFAGRRNVPMPKRWDQAYPILIESPLPEVRERALALAVQFGDERAFTLLRKIVPDRAQPMKERASALKTLLFQQKPDLVPILHDLLGDESLRGPAIRGLAAFDDPRTPKLLLKDYARYSADEKNDAIQTLASRGPFALALLDAIDAKTIPRADINSYTIRQLQALKSPAVAKKLAKVWGEVRPASADKAKLMAKYKSQLSPNVLKKANLSNGRALYAKNCASCHRLFGEGGAIGPDLTGSQRMNLDYVLENILDPSAIVPREFQVTLIETKKGRTLSGIVTKENDASITLQLQNEVVIVPKSDIDTRTPTKISMMPEGALDKMRIEEVRDLIGYLRSPEQVALKK
ncbi:MAG: c-type cytochrome [Planctomycetes bacterium]|nr:c-type cytochrome [Planctomycetota bacterium]